MVWSGVSLILILTKRFAISLLFLSFTMACTFREQVSDRHIGAFVFVGSACCRFLIQVYQFAGPF